MNKNGYSVKFYTLRDGKQECIGILRPTAGRMTAGLHRDIIQTLIQQTDCLVFAITDGGTTYTSTKHKTTSGVVVMNYMINGKRFPKKFYR